jgi:O-antigen/teichoic acid export membrane protein
MERIRHWLRNVLGLDRAIIFTVLARGWASLAGLVTVILIARFLSPAEQGYYYTYSSLVALQIVFELGFSFVILQMASHERAHLSISSNYEISGDPIAHARLASVFQKSVYWYAVAAVLLAVTLLLGGFHFFAVHQHSSQAVDWRLPWTMVAVTASITFQLDPVLSFLEGCGFVAKVARLRFAQAITGSFLAWMAFLAHHGLFAPAMMILGNVSASCLWLFGKRRLLLGLFRYRTAQHGVKWRKEVWPFQWRIAISWLSGYFIFQLFNPILFVYRGPVEAGRMGMSLSLASALQAIAISWLNTKSAPFGTMIAKKNYDELDRSFFQALKQSIVVFLAGATIIYCLSLYLTEAHIQFAQRILAPPILSILLLSTAINVTVFGQALYLRAHKQEKFLFNSVVGAILVASSTYFLGRSYGAAGMVIGNFVIALTFGLPSALFVFIKYRRAWHAA